MVLELYIFLDPPLRFSRKDRSLLLVVVIFCLIQIYKLVLVLSLRSYSYLSLSCLSML
jgi:hypothetical protein